MVTTFFEEPTSKLILILLILVISLVAQYFGSPYQDAFLNHAEMGSLVVLNFVFASTFVFHVKQEGLFNEALAYFVAIIILVYGGFLFFAGAFIKLRKVVRSRREHQRAEPAKSGTRTPTNTIVVNVSQKNNRKNGKTTTKQGKSRSAVDVLDSEPARELEMTEI
jgi:hypothetical protein